MLDLAGSFECKTLHRSKCCKQLREQRHGSLIFFLLSELVLRYKKRWARKSALRPTATINMFSPHWANELLAGSQHSSAYASRDNTGLTLLPRANIDGGSVFPPVFNTKGMYARRFYRVLFQISPAHWCREVAESCVLRTAIVSLLNAVALCRAFEQRLEVPCDVKVAIAPDLKTLNHSTAYYFNFQTICLPPLSCFALQLRRHKFALNALRSVPLHKRIRHTKRSF